MKAGMIIIPILILATNAYVAWRMYQILPTTWLKIAVSSLYVLALLTYIGCFIGMLGHGQVWPIRVNTALSPILVIYLYSLLIFLAIDLGRIIKLIPNDFAVSSAAGSSLIFGIIAVLLIIGAVNYRNKHRESIEISTEKPIGKPLKIIMASDLHLGYNNSRKSLSKWVDMINAEHPDIIIFGGDIIDVSTKPLFKDNFASEFRRLEAPIFAVFGNHEFISGAEQSMKFYHNAGITILRDSTVKIHGITIIGRNDLYANHMAARSTDAVQTTQNPARQSLSELMCGISPDDFTILLDHQPYHLEEAESAGIDFQFSGHTHRGQVWPISIITDLMYEKSWGRYQRGSTTYYISSGLGIWGPKFRLGSRSEYLVLTICPKSCQSVIYSSSHI